MNAPVRIEMTTLPAAAGLTFKHAHWPEIEARGGGAAWFHSEEVRRAYLGTGGTERAHWRMRVSDAAGCRRWPGFRHKFNQT